MKKMYHYKESGLDNVWLVNGFHVRQTSYGEALSIEDVEGLYHAIAGGLIEKVGTLSAKEVRFLRKRLGLSQKNLAMLLGGDEQTVARWERGSTAIPAAADRLLRAYYREAKEGRARVQELLTRLAELDGQEHERPLRLKWAKGGGAVQEWKTAA